MSADTARHGQVLTGREREVLSLVAEGLSNFDIAAKLFVSAQTVKSHLKAAFIKLGANSRANAVFLALKSGVIW